MEISFQHYGKANAELGRKSKLKFVFKIGFRRMFEADGMISCMKAIKLTQA